VTTVTRDGIATEIRRAWAAAVLACMGVSSAILGRARCIRSTWQQKAANPSGQVLPEAVPGIVSLIFWSLIIVISIKYPILIVRADNHGEGGIPALLAFFVDQLDPTPRRTRLTG